MQYMKKESIKIAAIMGGTFDPVHYGHLLAAERAREEYKIERIFFIPSGTPPHKSYEEMASSVDRYNMVELAVSSNPFFNILDIEIKRDGKSYTIDTVNQLIDQLDPACKLYLIIGADNAGDILNWKKANELLGKVEFIVVTRPGEWEERFKDEIEKIRVNGGKVNVLEIPMIPITSTEIRDRIRAGKSVKYIVPCAVDEYIEKNGLYKTS